MGNSIEEECGKTILGKNFDILHEGNRSQWWYVEWFDELYQIYQLPLPQPGIKINRMYCSKCGKARVRELELMNIEMRKIQAMNRQADEAKWRASKQNRLMREQIEKTEELTKIEEERKKREIK